MENEIIAVQQLIDEYVETRETNEELAEEQFIQMIAIRVEELMESNLELFFNHLYRMDVSEQKIFKTLHPATELNESVYVALARIIYERQKQRLESKKKYSRKDIDFWADDV
jgi:hypothetical protein